LIVEWGRKNQCPPFKKAIKQIVVDDNSVVFYLDDGFDSILKIVMDNNKGEWLVKYHWFVTHTDYESIHILFNALFGGREPKK
jgi:hypothetical protein